MSAGGGRYDFDDGGSYCGGWEDGKAHGQGVCTGPKGQGEYSGAWAYGFEASGVYVWPSGNTYGGEWLQGKRHGVGVEKKDKWTYRGEWTHGFKGRYGVRQSIASGAKYEGTWANGLQDGYGCEMYADGGTYQGQWQRGTRHGYGVRQSVSYGLAATYRARTLRTSQQSLHSEEEDDKVVKLRDKKLDETRGGFILTARCGGDGLFIDGGSAHGEPRRASRLASLLAKPKTIKRSLLTGLRLRKQRSAGDVNELNSDATYAAAVSMRSARSFASQRSTSSVESTMSRPITDASDDRSFYSQDDIADSNVTEMYMGEWNGDKRSGFGVSERSDGLKYEGEWYNNKKYGYGITTFKDGSREDGKYKNNALISSAETTNRLLLVQRTKLRERVETSALAARRAAQLALQKADIAMSRMANARAKAELAEVADAKARQDSDTARIKARALDPKFHQPGPAILKKRRLEESGGSDVDNENRPFPDTVKGRSASAVVQLPYQLYRPDSMGSGGGDTTPLQLGRLSLPNAAERTLMKNGIPNGRLRRMPEKTPPADSSYATQAADGDSNHDGSKNSTKFNTLLTQTVLSDHFDHYLSTRRIPGDAVDENHNRTGALSRSDSPAISAPNNPCEPGMFLAGRPRMKSDAQTAAATPLQLSKNRTDSQRLIVNSVCHKNNGCDESPAGRIPELTIPTAIYQAVNQPISLSKDDSSLLSSAKLRERVCGGRPSLTASKQMGSLPDISVIQDMSAMTRDEVMKLSSERREAIRQLLEENEKRRNGDVSMLAYDMKKWVQQRQLMMLVFAINLSVASFLYNLML